MEQSNKVSHTILPTCHLYNEARKRGIELVTADVYLKSKDKYSDALMISHLNSPLTEQLINAGVKPTILTCQESPYIATRFYTRLKKHSSRYKHSIVFSGMKTRLSSNTSYHQMFFPNSFKIDNIKTKPFSEKKLVTMISGCKKGKIWKKDFIVSLLIGIKVKAVYDQRFKIIDFFANKNFDLYGSGWDKEKGKYISSIKKVYRGFAQDKAETLLDYKFNFCFENTLMKGLITEKIFDCFLSGCVPIYLGAPDIEEYVDKNCFIDLNDFKNYDELYQHMLSIDEEKYQEYLKNINNYLHSDKYYKFTQDYYAKLVLDLLDKEFEKYA